MFHYWVLLLRESGAVKEFFDIDEQDDQSAFCAAQRLAGGASFEVWNATRRVAPPKTHWLPAMPVYRLEPVQELIEDGRWKGTALRETCWVLAENSEEARRSVALATVAVVNPDGESKPIISPWLDLQLANRDEDLGGIEVTAGIILTARGEAMSSGEDQAGASAPA
jgi:hypothetical protein